MKSNNSKLDKKTLPTDTKEKCLWCTYLKTKKEGEFEYPFCRRWGMIVNYPSITGCYSSCFKKRKVMYDMFKEVGRMEGQYEIV